MSTALTKKDEFAQNALASFGISQPWQTAMLLPNDWDDLSVVTDLAEALNEIVVVEATVTGEPQRVTRSALKLRVPVMVGNVPASAAVFDEPQPWLDALEVGGTYLFRAKVTMFRDEWSLGLREIVPSNWGQRLRPRYPGKPRVAPAALVRGMVLRHLRSSLPHAAAELRETLAPWTDIDVWLQRQGYEHSLERLLRNAHVPPTRREGMQAQDLLERVAAHFALAQARKVTSTPRDNPLVIEDAGKRVEQLPYPLTADQREAALEIYAALKGVTPDRRALIGDVGTGKTFVLLLALAWVVDAGGRSLALMPNLLLAQQFAQVARDCFPDLPIHLVAGDDTVDDVEAAQGAFFVGTTALLHRPLGTFDLVVVDEEQRFSREQKERWMGSQTHLLVASATCIPRTQALIQFGSLNCSRLHKGPYERTIHTQLWNPADRAVLFDTIKAAVADGQQLLVIYPLKGDAADPSQRAALEANKHRWEALFPGKVVTVSAQYTDEEKVAAIARLRDGSARVCVGTSVLECGIDLPDLQRVMVVHPDRFGLSQLHQIRGRVARRGGEGWCDLFLPEDIKDDTRARLEVLVQETSGFAIAAADLKLRGAGSLSPESLKQSGADETVLFGRPLTIDALEAAQAQLDA